MDAEQMTRYIIAAGIASKPDAGFEQLVLFAQLDAQYRAAIQADTCYPRMLITQLRTITDDETATARLFMAIMVARDKLRMAPSTGSHPGGKPVSGARRQRRVEGPGTRRTDEQQR
jgi:hypothetical protein